MKVDFFKSRLLETITHLKDDRMIRFLENNSQMDSHDILYLVKGLEYILTTYEVMLKKGYDSPFLIDLEGDHRKVL